jgi:hypothetical protein
MVNPRIAELLKGCDRYEPAPKDRIIATQAAMSVQLPDDYVAFLQESDGCEGPIGELGYLMLWRVAELPDLNQHHQEFIPGIVFIGSSGGGTAYGFALDAANRLVYVSADDAVWEFNGVREIGQSLIDLLEAIAGGDDFPYDGRRFAAPKGQPTGPSGFRAEQRRNST